jgi:hypothetical protein
LISWKFICFILKMIPVNSYLPSRSWILIQIHWFWCLCTSNTSGWYSDSVGSFDPSYIMDIMEPEALCCGFFVTKTNKIQLSIFLNFGFIWFCFILVKRLQQR